MGTIAEYKERTFFNLFNFFVIPVMPSPCGEG
jgi:hypothetical protein